MFLLAPLYVLVCIALILIVLIQPGKEESLGTIMGGAAAQNLFGSRTTTVLTKITTVLASSYLVVALLMAGIMDARKGTDRAIQGLQDEVREIETIGETEAEQQETPSPSTGSLTPVSPSEDASSSSPQEETDGVEETENQAEEEGSSEEASEEIDAALEVDIVVDPDIREEASDPTKPSE